MNYIECSQNCLWLLIKKKAKERKESSMRTYAVLSILFILSDRFFASLLYLRRRLTVWAQSIYSIMPFHFVVIEPKAERVRVRWNRVACDFGPQKILGEGVD
jgi:hypothetical protein